MGTPFERLAQIDKSRSRSTAIDAQTEKDIREADALNEAAKRRAGRHLREAAITAEYDKKLAARKEATGTASASQEKALEGMTLKDVEALPKASRTTIGVASALEQLGQFERAVGAGSARNAAQGPDRPIMVGKGAADEPYFTNLTQDELHSENRTANAIREKAGMDQLKGPRDLKALGVGNTLLSGGGDVRSQEERELDRKLNMVRETINAPGKKAASAQEYSDELENFSRAFGLKAARKKVSEDIKAQKLTGRGITARDAQLAEANLVQRGANSPEEEEAAGADVNSYTLPWDQPKVKRTPLEAKKEKEAAKLVDTRFATVFSNNGQLSKEEAANKRAEASIAGLLGDVAGDTQAGEAPSTYQLASRRGQQRPEKRVPYGGSGGSIDSNNLIQTNAPFFPPRREGSGWGFLEGSGTALGEAVEGLGYAAGGREHGSERKRRLAREKKRRERGY